MLTPLADLLREASSHHHAAEKRLPEHDWEDWYASYIGHRRRGYGQIESLRHANRRTRQHIKEC